VSATARRVSQLRALEAEAVFVVREVVAELSRPVLLFSGGKDSVVLLRIAEKAFRPLPLPFPVLHVDTGHNFPEVIEFRDRRIAEAGHRLIVASVQASIDAGRVKEEAPGGSRNRLQTVTLLDALEEHRFDAAFGEPAATRSARGPRSGCSRFATSSGSGSRASSVPSRGRFTTRGSGAASTSGCFR
jgi:sulfate adenylyltransferase subunit 2